MSQADLSLVGQIPWIPIVWTAVLVVAFFATVYAISPIERFMLFLVEARVPELGLNDSDEVLAARTLLRNYARNTRQHGTKRSDPDLDQAILTLLMRVRSLGAEVRWFGPTAIGATRVRRVYEYIEKLVDELSEVLQTHRFPLPDAVADTNETLAALRPVRGPLGVTPPNRLLPVAPTQ